MKKRNSRKINFYKIGMDIDPKEQADKEIIEETGMTNYRLRNYVRVGRHLYFIELTTFRPWDKKTIKRLELPEWLADLVSKPNVILEFSNCNSIWDEQVRQYQLGSKAVENGELDDPSLAHFKHHFYTLTDAINAFGEYVGETFEGVHFVDEIEHQEEVKRLTNMCRKRHAEARSFWFDISNINCGKLSNQIFDESYSGDLRGLEKFRAYKKWVENPDNDFDSKGRSIFGDILWNARKNVSDESQRKEIFNTWTENQYVYV